MYLRFPGLKRRGLWAHGSAADERGTDANRLAAYDVVRIVLGLVLLTAAASKGHQLATEPVAETNLFTSRWFLISVVEFELFFGLWLLAGLYPRSTWATALLCFGGFACVSLCKAFSGEATCGCFGKVEINPWYTLTLDALVVTSLLHWRPTGESRRTVVGVKHLSAPAACVVAIWLAAGIPAALAMGSYQAATISETGDIVGDNQFVLLEPETWVGKRLPLLKYIDIGEQLAEGEWTFLLVYHDCPKCRELLDEIEENPNRLNDIPQTRRFALIEMPPYGPVSAALNLPESLYVRGRLKPGTEWFAETPVVLRMDAGRVLQVVKSIGFRAAVAAQRPSLSQASKG